MRRISLQRPSPALIVATIALFLAAGGTTYALTLPVNSVGSPQIQAGRVLNSKLAPGSITASRLASNSVVFSKLANNQMTGDKIRNGTLHGEDLADNTITGKQVDESTLKITRFALVDATGKLVGQSGGLAVTQVGLTVIVNFGASVAGRPIQATLAPSGSDLTGQISAAPCGGPSAANPNAVTCPAPYNDANHVTVQTADNKGTAKALPFSVAVADA